MSALCGSVEDMRIEAIPHLAVLKHFTQDLGILERQQLLTVGDG